MIVKYVNHTRAEFTLYGDDLTFIDPMELHTWEWSYELANSITGMGGSAQSFSQWPRTFSLELRMRGRSRAHFYQQVNTLAAVADADVIAQQPGRLTVIAPDGNAQYLSCYLAVAGDKPEHPRLSNFATRTVTVLAVAPYWVTETTTLINPSTEEEQSSTLGKKYNLRYGYRYSTALSGNTVNNTHYTAAPAVITIYGPAANPSVVIGGNTYAVNVTLLATDRLVIDQITHEIYTVSGSGAKINVFNNRDKTHNIFAPIPTGENAVVYSGEFVLSVALIQRRSELLWTD